jgi:protein-L-isoaspartate(D-aspartate) O-methyltransferase
LLCLAALAACSAEPTQSSAGATGDRAGERDAMIRSQIEARGVRDPRVLQALRAVPRHEFVPAALKSQAYADHALAIGHGQTISQPFIVAFMTEALALRSGEKVLEIGTGSGYQAAVLAQLGCDVYSIEIVEPLAALAAATLRRLDYPVHLRTGDGYRGWPEHAPFDRIIVTAAPEQVPQPLIDQLAVGGRMVLPIGDSDQRLVVLEKTPHGVERTAVLPVRFVPMTGEARRGR